MTSLAMLLAATNPVVSMFPQNVTFHAGFDDGTVEAAIGMTPDHSRSWKNYVLCDGLFGKALSRGMVGYQQRPEQPIVDGERPGSVVLWVRLNAEQQPRTRGLAKWEGGGGFFEAAGDGGARLIVMKSVDCHWGDGVVMLYVCRKDEFGKLLTRCVGARLTYTDWKVGDWRMVAAAWTTDKLFISVDGKPFAERPYDFPLGKLAGSVYVKSDYWVEKRDRGNYALSTFSVDEATVFDRKLSDAEVASIYEKTKKEAGLK